MTYRLNTDRLVFLSVLLWVLLPPGVFAWEGNPPGPDNVRWLEQFCSSYMQFLTLGGVLCAVIGFVCAVLVWLVHRLDWARSLKSACCLSCPSCAWSCMAARFPLPCFIFPWP